MAESRRSEQVRRTINAMRLALMPVACAVALFASFIFGLFLLDAAESLLCPASQMISGSCMAPWWPQVERCIMSLSVGLAAVSIVVTAFFVSPVARPEITFLVFTTGAVFALYAGLATSLWPEAFCAIGAGLATTMLLARSRFAQPHPRE